MTEIIRNDAQTIADIAVAATEVRTINGLPFVVLADGQSVKSLEPLLLQPMRKKGNVTLQDQAGFIKFFKRHQNPQSNIYADREKGSFRAIFNDDTALEIGWKDHTAEYAILESNAWREWQKNDGRKMSQTEFAQFIEKKSG
ncbi:DUF2303 family protein [Neisseria weixii]|uniref:DUF2303 family protein n=1 Tax=Neisseria weixii TaxID=1853276 RepID=UPI0035A0D6D3